MISIQIAEEYSIIPSSLQYAMLFSLSKEETGWCHGTGRKFLLEWNCIRLDENAGK